jgi:hypothetical protein
MVVLVLVPLLLGLSVLGRRAATRALKARGVETKWSSRVVIRGSGLLVTLALVVGVGFVQFSREQVTPRVEVVPGLAAAAGGVETGDLIVAVEGAPVRTFGELRESLLGGTSTKRLTVTRAGATLERTVTLREGVLGVKPIGEAVSGHALWSALRFPFVLPWLLSHTAADSDGFGTRASSGPMTAAWALLALAQAWWLTVLFEVLALVLAARK